MAPSGAPEIKPCIHFTSFRVLSSSLHTDISSSSTKRVDCTGSAVHTRTYRSVSRTRQDHTRDHAIKWTAIRFVLAGAIHGRWRMTCVSKVPWYDIFDQLVQYAPAVTGTMTTVRFRIGNYCLSSEADRRTCNTCTHTSGRVSIFKLALSLWNDSFQS